MNFLLLLNIIIVANTVDVFDFNTTQNINYTAININFTFPEMLEEIFPEEYMKAHLELKSDDEVREEARGGVTDKSEAEVKEGVSGVIQKGVKGEVSGGGGRDLGSWTGVLLLLLLTLF